MLGSCRTFINEALPQGSCIQNEGPHILPSSSKLPWNPVRSTGRNSAVERAPRRPATYVFVILNPEHDDV
jgi:hypothetical protein